MENKFTTNAILKNKNVEAFYEAVENAGTLNNSDYATDSDKLTYKYLSKQSKEVGQLYKEKREIQNSDISDKEKKAKTLEIQKDINKIVEESLQTLQEMKLDTDYASFEGTDYYKDEKGEWNEIKEDDVASGLSNTTYADYKNKVTKISSVRKKENKSVSDKDKIDILLNSTYTDEEKDLIYTNYIKSGNQTDKDYEGYKLINGLNNLDVYYNYKNTTFASDKIDDGTVNGKSVTKGEGTKKSKFIDYIENSEFDPLTRLYLYGTEYKLKSGEQKEFANMLNEKNLTAEEKKKIYLTLNGVVEYKDGTIGWK